MKFLVILSSLFSTVVFLCQSLMNMHVSPHLRTASWCFFPVLPYNDFYASFINGPCTKYVTLYVILYEEKLSKMKKKKRKSNNKYLPYFFHTNSHKVEFVWWDQIKICLLFWISSIDRKIRPGCVLPWRNKQEWR